MDKTNALKNPVLNDETYFSKVVALADYVTSTWNPKMKWTWGEGLLGYALTLLDDYLKTDRYQKFLCDYCDYYVAHPPTVDCSDTSTPGLITYRMGKITGNPGYIALTERVLHFIKAEPRVLEDSINHLGNSREGKFYPKSVWVDSLMMFSVFPSLYASENNDAEMMTIAARQPRVLAQYLMDPSAHLWYHSYWVKSHHPYPRRKLFWGRGNGWVIASLPMILENIGEHEEKSKIIDILHQTSEALLTYQRTDGAFDTILSKKRKSYRELSFTALVASGWLKAVRLGYLDDSYLEPALKAYQCVIDALQFEGQAIFMPEISGPTIPLPIFPYLGYRLIPTSKNWSYGLAALFMAGIEFDKLRLRK